MFIALGTNIYQAPAAVQTARSLTEAPTPRVGSASTVLNGIIYLFSGRSGVTMAPIEENGGLWTFNPSISQWKLISPANTMTPYPAARSFHTMTNNGNNTLYLHAGCPEKGRLSDLWAFDVNAKVWKSLPAAPDPPRGGTSIAHCAGKIYRMNGFDGQKEQGGSLDIYDLGGNTWSTITYAADGKSGPEARSVSALLALQIKGKDILVTLFGERDPSSLGHAGAGKMLGDIWVYDIAGKNWSKLETNKDTPQPRGWFDADVVKGKEGNEAIVVHGGLAEDNSRLGDVWIMRFK
jgi:N-acetylneuraminic acid mutarotase